MTTRQKVERLLDRLSEEELADEYRRLQQTVGGEQTDSPGRSSDRSEAG